MPELDFLITGATVFDGVNPEPIRQSVGIRGTKIDFVGPRLDGLSARQAVHVPDLVLCPGFIDTHASTGLGYRFPHAGDNKLFQGVTTEIIGNCGTSTAPIGELLVPTMHNLARQIGFAFDWRSLGEWFAGVEEYGLPFNTGTFVGHSTLRAGVCADVKEVSQGEIDQMCSMLDEAMREGALGLSTGLVYAPGSFADTNEIVQLAKIAARHGGIYVSHIRDERQDLTASIEEAIEIGQRADLRVLVSHLKAAEKPNWGKMEAAIELIETARNDGVEITFEVYPYSATSTKLRTFIPKDTLRDGVAGMVRNLQQPTWRQRSVRWLEKRGTDFDAMVLITESIPGAAGKSIQKVATENNRPPGDTVVDVLLEDPDAWIVYHCMSDDDVDAAVMWQDSIVASDSWSYPVNAPTQIGQPHPRTYGAFTRFLEMYALATPRIPFGEAVRKITSLPADWLGLEDRGRIKEGCYADLALLNPENVKERATYTEPRQFSEGTEFVWVNGTLMISSGVLQGHSPGQILRKV